MILLCRHCIASSLVCLQRQEDKIFNQRKGSPDNSPKEAQPIVADSAEAVEAKDMLPSPEDAPTSARISGDATTMEPDEAEER